MGPFKFKFYMMKKDVNNKINTTCFCCGSNNMESVLSLPNFPLTGYYIEPQDEFDNYFFDQELLICNDCGHGQLKNIVDPKYLYDDQYSHRGSLSPIASGGNYFFLDYLLNNVNGDKDNIIDIGCNDLLLIKLIKEKIKAKGYNGLDPIWIGKDHSTADGINVLGKFSDEITSDDISGKLDLIVSCHTFEHVPSPLESLKRISELCNDNADFFIEVPSMETLIELNRIDQVFHQHVNYFSVCSMTELFKQVGFSFIGNTFNYNMWGGTMILHFKKGTHQSNNENKKILPKEFKNSYSRFKTQVEAFEEQILKLDNVCYYGAAQMLPALLYHLKNEDLSKIKIYDDNENRIGLKYPNSKLHIHKPPKDLSGYSVVITALDSYRPIMKKLISLNPRRIVDFLNTK